MGTGWWGWRHKRIRYVGLEASEALVIAVWAILNGAVLAWQFIYQLSLVKDLGNSVPVLVSIARAVGHCNNLNMGLLLLPVARNSLWAPLLGISYERFIRLHRWCARFLLLSVTTHMLLWWSVWIDSAEKFPSEKTQIKPYWRDVAIVGHSTWVVGMIMFALAFHYIRRTFFEVFYYTHHLFIVFIGLALAHNFLAKGFDFTTDLLMYYILPGVFFYVIDRIVRFRRSRVETDLVSLTHQPGGILFAGRVTRLEVLRSDMSYEPGQFCFINVPAISRLEWHPFSIASAPHEKTLRFIVQAKNKQSWSDKLYKLAYSSTDETATFASTSGFRLTPRRAQELSFSGTVEVKVDGPYGDFSYYYSAAEIVVLIGGGIGITPLIGILKHLVHKMTSNTHRGGCKVQKLYFFWACKKVAHFNWVQKELRDIFLVTEGDERFELLLFITKKEGEERSTDFGNEEKTKMPVIKNEQPSGILSVNDLPDSEAEGRSPRSSGILGSGIEEVEEDVESWRGKRGSKRARSKKIEGSGGRVKPPTPDLGSYGSDKYPLVGRNSYGEKSPRRGKRRTDADEPDFDDDDDEEAGLLSIGTTSSTPHIGDAIAEEPIVKLIPHQLGRPDLCALLMRVKQAHAPTDKTHTQQIHVLCCGPSAMAETVCGLCDELSDCGSWWSNIVPCCAGVGCCCQKKRRGKVDFVVGAYNFLL